MRTIKSFKSKYIFAVLVAAFSLLGPMIDTQKANAANAQDFNPGRIIDDGIFTNKNSMGWEQIQRFFNSKGTNCKANQAPCLKNYTEGGKTAAQIIFDAGQEFNINPQVLVVLIQKEVGLVTATAPMNWQYTSAAGYGCPDSTPSVCNSNYYGFTNQIRWASRMFSSIMTANSNWYTPYVVGSNSILWNQSSSCGRSSVTIQNRATQALYNYTPYRPNPAALNAGYGTGDSCSSYGNRNFFLYFNDWFGTSYRGPLWRTLDSGDLFYIDDGKKFIVPSMDVVTQFGMTSRDISYVTQTELNAVPLASGAFNNTLGYVIKANNDSALYIVNGGYRTPIRTMDQFAQFGFTSEDIKVLPATTLANLLLSSKSLSNYIQKWDGSVYKVENGTKRSVYELSMVSEGYTTPTPDAIIDRLTFGKAYMSNDNFVIYGPDSGIRLYTPSGYHEIASMDVYSCWNLGSLPGFRTASYTTVPHTKKEYISTCITKQANQNSWTLMNGTSKIDLGQDSGLSGASTDSSLLERTQTVATGPVLKGYLGSELSILADNKKRAIPNLKIFSDLSYTSANVTTITQPAYDSLAYGPRALSVGTLLLEPGGGISVVNSSASRLQVMSTEQFNDFGFDWSSLIPVNQTDLSGYSSMGSISKFVLADNNEVYLVDKSVRYLIPAQLDSVFGITRNNLPILKNKAFFETTLPWTMSAFIKANNDNGIYRVENGVKRPLSSWETFMRESGNRPQDIVVLSPRAISSFTTGSMKY